MRCLFCAAAKAMEIRWDKKGRPYMGCRACDSRVFSRGALRIAIYSVLADVLDASADWAAVHEAAALRVGSILGGAAGGERREPEVTHEPVRQDSRPVG